MDMPQLDGNVLAGALMSLFGPDATMLTVECGGCGAVARLAEAVVEQDDVAAIVRCRSCTHTLFTVLEQRDEVRIMVESIRSISTA